MNDTPLPLAVDEWKEKFIDAQVDPEKEVPPPSVILNIMEAVGTQYEKRPIFSLGNISAIQGKSKAGKTMFMSMILPALIERETKYRIISPEVELLQRRPVIAYIDTEQAEYHCYQTMLRIAKCCRNSDNFGYYKLRPYSPAERLKIIEAGIKHLSQYASLFVIDGIIDLTTSYNDEEKASELLTTLMRWTDQYNIHICNIIHENFSTGNDNATGWLGRLLYQKCESVLQIKKVANSRARQCKDLYPRGRDSFSDIYFGIESGYPAIIHNYKETTVNETAF